MTILLSLLWHALWHFKAADPLGHKLSKLNLIPNPITQIPGEGCSPLPLPGVVHIASLIRLKRHK